MHELTTDDNCYRRPLAFFLRLPFLSLHSAMATYVYETISQQEGEAPRRFELVQSMKDAPLVQHPDTGEPIKRVIIGGYGLMGLSEKKPSPNPVAACQPGCACHRGARIPSL